MVNDESYQDSVLSAMRILTRNAPLLGCSMIFSVSYQSGTMKVDYWFFSSKEGIADFNSLEVFDNAINCKDKEFVNLLEGIINNPHPTNMGFSEEMYGNGHKTRLNQIFL